MSAVGTPFAQAAMRLASAVVGLIEAAAAIPGSVEVRGEEVYNELGRVLDWLVMAILAMDDEHPGAAMFSVGEMRSFADLLTAAADGIEGEAGR